MHINKFTYTWVEAQQSNYYFSYVKCQDSEVDGSRTAVCPWVQDTESLQFQPQHWNFVPFHLCSVDSTDLFNEQLKTHFSSMSLSHLFLTVSDFIVLDYSFMWSTSWSLSWNAPSEKYNLITYLSMCMSEGLVRWCCAWVKLWPIKFNIAVF